MKITLHCYIINYYLTQWTDNRMPDKRGTDNRGSTVPTKFYRQMHSRIFQQKVQPKTPQTKPSTYLLFRLPYLGSISHHN